MTPQNEGFGVDSRCFWTQYACSGDKSVFLSDVSLPLGPVHFDPLQKIDLLEVLAELEQ